MRNVTDASLWNVSSTKGNHSANVATVFVDWYPPACAIFGCGGLISNTLVCIVLLKHITKRPFTKRYTMSLAIGNVLYSWAAIYYFIQKTKIIPISDFTCKVIIFTSSLGYYGCVGSLMLMAFERFCAIKFPIFFRKLTGPKKIRKQLVYLWISNFLLTVYPVSRIVAETHVVYGTIPVIKCAYLDGTNIAIYHLIFDTALPLIIFLSLTFYAICILQKRAVGALGPSNGAKCTCRKKKPWINLCLIVFMFSLCFLPYCFYCVAVLVAARFDFEGTFADIAKFSRLLTLIHTCFVPIMHWVLDSSFRKMAVSTLCCQQKVRQESSNGSGSPFTIG